MKFLNILLVVVLVLSVSLVALVMAIEENAYDLEYYMNSYSDNGVFEKTGKNQQELEEVSKAIITYLKGRDDKVLDNYFNEKEIHHMEDVLGLFHMARIIKLVASITSLGIVFWFLAKEKAGFMGKWVTLGLFANHIVLMILAVLVVMDFSKYFTVFHEIFFNNDLWILDPRKDLMIQMLPEPFFVNMAKNIGISFIKFLAVAQLVGYIFYKKGRYMIGRFKSNKRY